MQPDAESGVRPNSFLAALFDLSFTSFITSKIIKVTYAISVALAALFSLAMMSGAIQAGTNFIFAVIGAALFFLLATIYVRLLLELVVVIFRASEQLAELVEQGRRRDSPTLLSVKCSNPDCGFVNMGRDQNCVKCGRKL